MPLTHIIAVAKKWQKWGEHVNPGHPVVTFLPAVFSLLMNNENQKG